MSRPLSGPVVALGELLLRLSPPDRRKMVQAQNLDLTVGGAEANVLVGLSRMGHATRLISRVPNSVLGDLAIAHVRSHGVDTDAVVRGDGRMGLYFLEQGQGARASAITYDRAGSSFARAGADDLPIAQALSGAALLHLSGITPALGPNGTALAMAAAGQAQAMGIPVSFDGNYRAQLWAQWDGDARSILTGLMAHVRVFFGNHRDIALLLGQPFSGDGPDRRRSAALAAFAAFPNLQLIASTARTVITADHHQLSARVDTPTDSHQTDVAEVDGIVDRIGTGDAFAAGVLDRYIHGDSLSAMAQRSLACAVLKHTIVGDMPVIDADDIAAFQSGSGDVRR